jgi:cytochrome c-type biogenesis protein CcmF
LDLFTPSLVEVGTFCMALSLTLNIAQVVVVALSVRPSLRRIAYLSEGLMLGGALTALIAFLILINAFVGSDFSVANVAHHSHTLKPLLYKISGAWASHEGSMLLWCMILNLYGAAVVIFGRNLPDGLKHKVLAAQGLMAAAFMAFTLFSSNPLARMDVPPIEGESLNPLLQDPALAIHPPMLYLGYVGFSVVFSFAVAALIEGRLDRAWARWVRPWTLLAWSFLTLGITLGSFWAYYELGWGGWWFWDPVENASFMPWLAGTALLHSAIVMEKRDALKSWTVFLALLAFTFAMMGAFLVRSGVLTSVHAFAVDPKRGIILLIILFGLAGAGFSLFGWRIQALKPGGLFAPLSREAALVVNNILLTAALATVFLGTMFPLLMEALAGKTISVGAPYFLLTFVPLMLAAIVILPFAIVMSWKRADVKPIAQRLMALAGLSVVLGVIGALGHKGVSGLSYMTLACGLGFGAWLILGSLRALIDRVSPLNGTVARRLRGLPLAFLGMTCAHIGLGVFILGASYENHVKLAHVEALKVGGEISIADKRVTLMAVGSVDGPNYQAIQATLRVRDAHDRAICEAKPQRRFYPASRQTTSEVALCLNALDDLYFVLGEPQTDEAGQTLWQVRALYNPWVHLIFFGPMIMLLGGVLSLCDRHLRFGVAKKAKGEAV